MVKLLFQTHVHCTLNSPIEYHKFAMISLDLNDVPQNIVDTCYNKYKQTPEGSLRGSVDVDPVFWTNVFFSSYNLAKENNKSEFNVPNGCCNNKNCGIKKFYEFLYDFCCDIVKSNQTPENEMGDASEQT